MRMRSVRWFYVSSLVAVLSATLMATACGASDTPSSNNGGEAPGGETPRDGADGGAPNGEKPVDARVDAAAPDAAGDALADAASDAAGDAAADAKADAGPLVCDDNSLRLRGNIGAQALDNAYVVMGRSLNQINTPKTLTYTLAGGGTVRFEWAAALPNGQTTSATGYFTLPGSSQVCFAVGSFTLRANNTEADVFSMQGLSEGAVCPGAAITGMLEGCGRL